VGKGGVHLPASSTEIAAPWNVKIGTLAPEPTEVLEIKHQFYLTNFQEAEGGRISG